MKEEVGVFRGPLCRSPKMNSKTKWHNKTKKGEPTKIKSHQFCIEEQRKYKII